MIKILSLITLLSSLGFAADDKSQTLVEILKDDEVSAHYSKCKTDEPDNIENCLWSKLDASKQEEIRKKLSSSSKGDGKETKTQYDALNLSSGLKTEEKKERDPAIAKLEDYLSKRLAESLYGDATASSDTKIKVVDHKVFYDLYETQVSKSVISSISSYCVDASPGTHIISNDEEKRKKQRETNLKDLQNFNPSADGKTQDNEASKSWTSCMVNLQDICSKKNNYKSQKGADFEYSQKRACVITKLIKDARQNLLKVAQIKKLLQESNKEVGSSVLAKKGQQEVYTGAASGDGKVKDIDELTTITSSDLAKSGFEEGNKAKVELLKKCKETPDDGACKDILLQGKAEEEAEKKNTEYALRTKALEAKLEKENFTNEEVKSYLKEQGYSEEDVKKLVESNPNLEKIKAEIKERYSEERKALVAAMNDKLNAKSIKAGEEQNKSSKIEDLAKEIETRPEEYKSLIHYNNIVAGFLSFKSDGSATAQGNSASIARELSATEGLKESEVKERKDLENKMKTSGVKLDTKSSQSVTLDVKDINANLLRIDATTATTPEGGN